MPSKRRKLGPKDPRPESLSDQLMSFVRDRSYRPMSAAELATALGVRDTDTEFSELLKILEGEGKIVKTRYGRYGAPERMNLVVGRLQGHPKGFGFVIPDDSGVEDVFIPAEAINGAWHQDRVIARLGATRRGGGREERPRVEGEIIRILERANPKVVGTYYGSDYSGFVRPDERRLPQDIIILGPDLKGAVDGETVWIEIIQWSHARKSAVGRIIERLGPKGEPGVDILAIVRRFELPEAFPDDVLAEAEQIPSTVEPDQITNREDARDIMMVTIDGSDAKDLDDAVSLEVTDFGFRLGVHIADVSHYVREGSALDLEARRRATSVYLVDRVIPMLPPSLSNGICSLNPKVDRLAVTVFIDYDHGGRRLGHRLCRSVIRTRERMTYEMVAALLEERAGREDLERYRDLIPMFKGMRRLMELLRAARFARGSLDFDLSEEKVILDQLSRPLEIKPALRTVADQIIEEFMLQANETVAEEYLHREAPFMYRIHEEPDLEKIQALSEFLWNFGINLLVRKKIDPKSLQRVLDAASGRPEENLINTVVLRSLKQARYSPESTGHFGLATEYYCHFTSPIRRYPDLFIHRVITQTIERGLIDPAKEDKYRRVLGELADHCSDMERRADEAERETIDLKKAEFVSDKIGEVFGGVVSGVTNFGLFVKLENTVEGLVHISTLVDDYYSYNEKGYSLIGARTKKVYRLGDQVRVKVESVDLNQRQVDLTLVGPIGRRTAFHGRERTPDNKPDKKPDKRKVKGRRNLVVKSDKME